MVKSDLLGSCKLMYLLLWLWTWNCYLKLLSVFPGPGVFTLSFLSEGLHIGLYFALSRTAASVFDMLMGALQEQQVSYSII